MDVQKMQALETQYRDALLKDVIPFWEKYSVDRERGGYFTCLDRDGTLFDSDKFMWLQGRQVWMFSMLHNRQEQRPEWLDVAKTGFDFMKRFGRDEKGDWYFALDQHGRPLVAASNIFSDCFAALGFAEYYGATGDESAKEIALNTYWRIQARKENPKGSFNKVLAGAPDIISHSLPMISVGMTMEISKSIDHPDFAKIIDENIDLITTKFIDRNLKTMFEHVHPDGSHPKSMLGRVLNPGHALESMWFLLEVARARNDQNLIKLATDVMLWTIDRGWDETYGGIFYFMDYEGFPPDQLEWDMKLWWVHLEALYAFALAYHLTGDARFETWYDKIHDYTWAHFPDPEYGEWYGYLNRRGEVTHTLKGGKWKGCFHVPRALFLCSEIFKEMQASVK